MLSHQVVMATEAILISVGADSSCRVDLSADGATTSAGRAVVQFGAVTSQTSGTLQ